LDRPWAAWLYLGGVAQRARDNRLDTVEIDLGLVGPSALGREIQSGWHRLIGSPQPCGWHNQIPNEPAFLVSYLTKSKHLPRQRRRALSSKRFRMPELRSVR
jgi:lipid A 3-O-deacylase